jgi:metal-responsive CopG/Arc/MetJ family transcriptional regulator
MPKAAAKMAVSVPGDLYRTIERVRKRRRISRSAVVQDALRLWLRTEAEQLLVREYEAGYRARPETRRERNAALAAAVRLLGCEEW